MEYLLVGFCHYNAMRQHARQKLHHMAFGSVDYGSYSTWLVVLPKPLAGIINLDFVKITYENRDTSPTLAAGVLRCRF